MLGNTQYSRRECYKVVGIPDSVQVEDKMHTIFQISGCEVTSRDIEACHRLKTNSDRVIAKIARLPADHVSQKRLDCQATDPYLSIPAYVHATEYYGQKLRNYDLGNLKNLFILNGIIKAKINESSRPISITQTEDFDKFSLR